MGRLATALNALELVAFDDTAMSAAIAVIDGIVDDVDTKVDALTAALGEHDDATNANTVFGRLNKIDAATAA